MEEEWMTPRYFQLIREELSQLWCTYEDRIELLKMDVRILDVFFTCLETWKYSIDEENEESMERLTSVITSLQAIWPEDFTILLLPLLDRRGKEPIFEDVDSAMFELEGIIAQSKKQVEGWCRYSIHSSMMQCKSKEFPATEFSKEISYFLSRILWSLIEFYSYRTGTAVPLQKQIDILRGKIDFLNFEHFPEGKDINEFLNLIGDFANSAACFTCLYWVKKDDDETASEMNTVLFDMLQKFIPYAYYITPLYVDYNLQPMSNSFLLGEVVESLVDFFFDHLAIVLKDDFLFLRDRLMFLFTFLTNPPCENIAEEEGDLIRSQIYAILHQDVYLLLSFDEMNNDFSDEKTLFSACMIRIDIVNANIRQLYCGSSYSSITLEVEKMEYDYFVSLHRELSSIEKHANRFIAMFSVVEKIQLYKMELKFLRVFLLWLATWDDTDEEMKVKMRSMITSFRGIWGEKEEEGLLAHRLHAIRRGDFDALRGDFDALMLTDLHPLAFELQGKIHQSELEIGAWCVNLFQSSVQFKTSTSYKILEFMDSMLDNFNYLLNYKADKTFLFKNQIETLKEKLIFFKNFMKLAVNCKDYEELGEFKMSVQAFVNDAACLAFLYWTKDANAKSASETNSMLFHLLQKIKPSTPNVARLYFGTLMAIYAHRSDSHMFGQTAFSFVELFLEDLVTHLKDDDFQILQDNILFLLTFLNDPSNQYVEKSICSRIDVLFWEGFYGLIPFDDMEGGFSRKKVLLNDFMMKIEAINAHIRHIYGKFPDSFLYDFPKIISPQFLDFLMQNLRNLKDRMNSDRKYVTFAKYKIIKIEEELASLYPFFIRIFDLQSELNETWLEVVNVPHLTEHVIMSCISSSFVFDHPFWYHTAYLSDVLDEIKAVKAKLEMNKLENIMNNAGCLPSSVGFISEPAEQGRPLEINEIFVGFEDEKAKIIGMLTSGPKSLDIVSIVGMGGLGKTTLARKVFGSSLVRSHFDVFAFCSVSLDHNTRRMLHDIIRDVKGVDDISRDMTNDDLAHEIHKCLSRQKYLIVLDDIWNISAWNELKSSFPDHENGSRVKTEESLRSWSEVATRLVHYLLSDEGCMEILELSYKHLPENLKPCLIYLGAFLVDSLISVKHVIQLWIAEGFVQESKTKSLEDVAKEYFHDLVARSFIIVGVRSSSNEIKTFRVHDLIHDLCQMKCRDGNFFQLNYEITSSSFSEQSINKYRVSLRKENDVAAISSPSNARTICSFCENRDRIFVRFPFRKLGLVQVLDFGTLLLEGNDINQLTSMIHLRHIVVFVNLNSIPSSISNLWNVTSLTLRLDYSGSIHLPETFWRMKSLRYVNVYNCILKFSSDQILEKVVSFSKPILSTGKDVERLLQRLPVVRKLRRALKESPVYDEGSIETLDFDRELESLMLNQLWEFFELVDNYLEEWNASNESLPCLEQLVIECETLKELPSCFGEMPTLKRIVVKRSPEAESWALRIQEELMELGIQLEVSILKPF